MDDLLLGQSDCGETNTMPHDIFFLNGAKQLCCAHSSCSIKPCDSG